MPRLGPPFLLLVAAALWGSSAEAAGGRKVGNGYQLEKQNLRSRSGLWQPVPGHVKDAQIDVVGKSMGKQLEGLQKLREQVTETEKTLRSTDKIAENRTYILKQVLNYSDDLPAAMATAPSELETALLNVTDPTPPPSMNASMVPAFEAAVKEMRAELSTAAGAFVTTLATRVSNVTQKLKISVSALEEVKKEDAAVTEKLGTAIGGLGTQVDDQIAAMSQTRDLFASGETENAQYELQDDLMDLKSHLAGIRESLGPVKLDKLSATGFDNARKSMSAWRSKKEKLVKAVADFKRLQGKAKTLKG